MTARSFLAAAIAALLFPLVAASAEAGVINRACLNSNRDAASRGMCKCLQQVANQNLSRADQRLAASFFKNPHKAQEIRQSDRPAHERFWLRYKEFGVIAAASCSQQR
ncbi:hypothetical protein [Thiosulfatihalobacter marinus]|jgi:hypothetical protein|uniref:hypothetical protein n=1 Tax=Thiosulfatihalobacter marinus TaxID=2792481 RepID=UPI0018D735A3|nr:hypothetical protein [Thiosulfatihalobacter marinus]